MTVHWKNDQNCSRNQRANYVAQSIKWRVSYLSKKKLIFLMIILHSNISPESKNLDYVTNFLINQLLMSLLVKYTTPNVLKYDIHKLKVGKLPGYDLTKHFLNKTLVLLTFIYKFILKLFYFGLIWNFQK